eukprot:3173456-Amphidinium_carterae.1
MCYGTAMLPFSVAVELVALNGCIWIVVSAVRISTKQCAQSFGPSERLSHTSSTSNHSQTLCILC